MATTTPLLTPIKSAPRDDIFDEVAPDCEAKNSESAAAYERLVSALRSIHRPEDAQRFYALLMEVSFVRDEAGKPKIDAETGKPLTDGTVGRLIYHTGMLFLNHFECEAQSTAKDGEPGSDPELADAVKVLWARAFSGPVPTSGGTVGSRLSEAQLAGEGL